MVQLLSICLFLGGLWVGLTVHSDCFRHGEGGLFSTGSHSRCSGNEQIGFIKLNKNCSLHLFAVLVFSP